MQFLEVIKSEGEGTYTNGIKCAAAFALCCMVEDVNFYFCIFISSVQLDKELYSVLDFIK